MASFACDYDRRAVPAASRGKGPTIKADYMPTLHRTGEVSYWSVYQQMWVRTFGLSGVPDIELAAMGPARRKIIGAAE